MGNEGMLEVDVRTVQYQDFMNGFSYGYASAMQTNVTCYCSGITYLKSIGEMSLFG